MDQTKPVIEIEYDGAQPHRDNYYREARTAVVTIQEHNFTPDTFSYRNGTAISDAWVESRRRYAQTQDLFSGECVLSMELPIYGYGR